MADSEREKKKPRGEEQRERKEHREKKVKISEEELDEELEHTFPASDPPSHTSPGNNMKDGKG